MVPFAVCPAASAYHPRLRAPRVLRLTPSLTTIDTGLPPWPGGCIQSRGDGRERPDRAVASCVRSGCTRSPRREWSVWRKKCYVSLASVASLRALRGRVYQRRSPTSSRRRTRSPKKRQDAGGWPRSELVLGLDAHRPRELGEQRLGEGLLYRHVEALAPRDRDARVVVVDLGGAERDVLELVFGRALRLGLLESLRDRVHLRVILGLLGRVVLLLDLGDLLIHLGERAAVRGGRRLLVVAQLGDVLVGDLVVVVQRVDVALLAALRLRDHRGRLLQLGAQRDRRVVRAEDFGRQAGHDLLEIVVELGRVHQVEELHLGLLVLHELLDQLVDDGQDVGRVVVGDRVLAEEIKVQLVLLARVHLHVLDAQRAAADGVRLLVGVLLVAHTQR
mmetsp:Transcript_35203/g.97364  ORF Transcript_35203/g.97364 Transcript_35203/m.97364 type:complete len:390 (-) Transcript_35203:1078-2247(-)